MNDENDLNSDDFENDLNDEGIKIEHDDDDESKDSFMGSIVEEDDDGGEVDIESYDDGSKEEF